MHAGSGAAGRSHDGSGPSPYASFLSPIRSVGVGRLHLLPSLLRQAARSQCRRRRPRKDQTLAELEIRVRQLEAEQTPAAPERPLEAKERDSLLKSVIGMALDSYKYEPKLSRSTVPQQIADDLA